MSGPDCDPHTPDAQGFIQGIFNYCDRWCEKCRFVRQCRVGIVDVDDIDDDNTEVASEKVESYAERLRKVMDMGEVDEDEEGENEDRAEPGFDPDQGMEEPDPTEMAAYHREQEEIQKRIDAHPLSIMSDTYMDMVQEWMKEHNAVLESKGLRPNEPPTRRALALSPELLVLNEACEEVLWFHTMLPVKTHRAIRGKIEEPTFMEDIGLDPFQSDQNGTAKLVLLMVERCRVAWSTIAEMMPEEALGIEPFQELLRRHEQAMRVEFPDTEKFIRPGFDAPVTL